jgi:hypothetical protein
MFRIRHAAVLLIRQNEEKRMVLLVGQLLGFTQEESVFAYGYIVGNHRLVKWELIAVATTFWQ